MITTESTLAAGALTSEETASLVDCEEKIERGVRTFREVGGALLTIRDNRLYRSTHKTFETYCQQRWDMTRRHANNLIGAFQVRESLQNGNNCSHVLPANEAQARPLASVPEGDRAAVWQQCLETAPLDDNGDPKITARHIRTVVDGGDQSGDDDAPLVLSAHVGSNAGLIKAAADLYVNDGERVADVTFGKGSFWRDCDLSRFELRASDLIAPPADRMPDRFTEMDFRQLKYPDAMFDHAILDPPYSHNPGNPVFNENYRNGATTNDLDHDGIIRLYEAGMREGCRVLKSGGLLWVKCKDEIQSGKHCCSHVEIFNSAMQMELLCEDQFLLVNTKPPALNQERQLHSRKNHSFLWIFCKPKKARAKVSN